MEGGLEEPCVVLDAVPAQVLLHLGDVPGQAKRRQVGQPLLLRDIPVAVSVLLVEGPGQFLDILPVVAVLREGDILLPQKDLQVPGLEERANLSI